jgi:hypothetical protein
VHRILVVGFSTRHVAASANRAGYEVYAIDHFCDLDLIDCTVACSRFDELSQIPSLTREFCSRYQIDAIIVTSGAEDLTDIPVPILGTQPDVASRFLDKIQAQQFFESHGFPVPPLAQPGEFPAILKPSIGSGGWRNAIVTGEADIRAWEEQFLDAPYLLQRIAPGIPASVCCVSDGVRAKALAVNLQIMRGTECARFGFSGSMTPFTHPMEGRMRDMAEEIAAKSGCQGILGIDFLVTNSQIFPIEVNPRFVATLDTIERSTGLNMVSVHIKACQGVLPLETPSCDKVSIRKILFAQDSLSVKKDLRNLCPAVADIPALNASFLAGEAVISVFGEGADELTAQDSLDKTIRMVSQYMR